MTDFNQSRKIKRFFAEFITRLRKWLNKIGSPVRISRRSSRQMLGSSRGRGKRVAGFVLPTVTLVTLVVTLLVVTTIARSSERAQSAANARQEQVFRSAATPLVDRARAKIDALLNEELLAGKTPAESELDSVITSDSGKYTFPDETRLQLVYNFPDTDPKINISGSIDKREYVSTAWKFPIDTDNNGKFDSYGLYSILFRTRPPEITNRPLVPIEARALPMDETTLASSCVHASDSVNGSGNRGSSNKGWTFSSDNRIRKSFFVYAVTLPITDEASFPTKATNYEPYKGVTSISAVELQQDRARLPQNNNAVFFEGDLELVKVPTFRINGRIYTAGSLMIGANTDAPISFYQVSSSGGALNGTATTDSKLFGSCYYEKMNSEIIVAGQVVEGDTVDTDPSKLSVGNSGRVNVDLFYGAGEGVPPDTVAGGRVQIDDTNQSVTDVSSKVALNDFAYNNRIAALVNQAIIDNGTLSGFSKTSLQYTNASTKDPTSVQEDLIKRIQDEALSSLAEIDVARRSAFEVYFRERTRRVTFAEVPFGGTDTFPSPLLTRIKSNTEFAPPASWIFPLYKDASFGKVLNVSSIDDFQGRGGYLDGTKGVTLATASNRLKPQASEPATVKVSNESLLGDRLLVGNGLPARWLKKSDATGPLDFVGESEPNYVVIATGSSGFNWDNPTNAGDRYRNTRSVPLSNLGGTERGGFWEISAALNPAVFDLADTTKPLTDDIFPKTGGLRVVTNAGIYSSRSEDTFLQRFRTGSADDTSTSAYDESRMPFWNGSKSGNNITKLDERKFATTTNNYVVWSDSMPMTGGLKLDGTADTRKGDLQMRATAIYHYKYDAFNPIGDPENYQKPIACVSSYYDPSTPITAKNGKVANGTSLIDAPWNFDANGRSNNGLVYQVGTTASDTDKLAFGSISYDSGTGLFSGFNAAANNPSDKTINYSDRLAYQANLILPNGRFVNEPLREVLIKIKTNNAATPKVAKLTLPQQSTIDSNLCALQILDGSIKLANESSTTAAVTLADNAGLTGNPEIPHGTFRESAFLDGRELKSFNRNESLTESANGNNAIGTAVADNGLAIAEKGRADIYDLEIEQRQPLEIRATDIDMDRLRGSKISGGNNKNALNTDYLLPYSGLIYATREDALQDLSYFDKTSNDPNLTDDNKRKALSSTDFLVDPTRKPSSIRLINGYRLWRSTLTTANLTNTNGSLPISDPVYASYPWNDATKGEKGLTLVSNLPVYVKAQYDPVNASATPSFNKHTKEEFTLLLNENVASPTTIWDNFYKRHADNGNGDKLDPNFACRPKQNTNCQDGDEWKPATVLADAVTVLSANYRDGYRTDGDYDLRNNANTSTSLNWQSQLNPSAEKVKDSSYVLDRRRNGFLNNDFVTNARWLSPVNSDGGVGASTNLWAGEPHNASPANGNLVSYNANGVTPIQRRLDFSEYGMELCRKFPVGECTFSDWVKAGAGTTTMPDFAANGTVSTSLNAPRFISNDDSRYARRLSFLRFDDIYKDGNQQLIFAGACSGGSYSPMPIGVTNGNLDTGFTYPQAMGSLGTPFDTQRNNSYGVVPCPESAIAVGGTSVTSNVIGNVASNNHDRPRAYIESRQKQPDADSNVDIDKNNEAVPWSVFASLPTSGRSPMAMVIPPAAAYPFYHTANPSSDIKFRRFDSPSRLDGTLGNEGGRYVWGNDVNGNGLKDTGERDDVFPDIPPSSGRLGEIPMLPGNLAKAIDNTNDDQMTNRLPAAQARTLWYRTAESDSDRIGRSDRLKYNNNGNLFINNLSFPAIADSRGNLSSMGRLILPDVPCISLADGTVDERCSSKSYTFGTSAPTDASTTLLNLNLPHNPHFPSDNASTANTSNVIPASTYTVCGPSGSSQLYQALQNSFIGKTDIANTTPCPTAPIGAIRSFVGTLPTVTGTSLSGGTGILSAKLNPGNTGTDIFVGLVPSTSGILTSTATPPAISPVIRATNTYSNNKVHVYNIASLGKLDGGVRVLNGTLTFRANCADPQTPSTGTACTPNSIRRGTSPVFIMRGAPSESIEFSGLKIVLDGVDPNNIFWVAARADARLCLSFNQGNPNKLLSNGSNINDPCGKQDPSTNDEDPRLSNGKRIILSGNKLPPEFADNTTFYVVERSGATFQLSLTPGGSRVNFTLPGGLNAGWDTRLASEPSFIFSGGAPTQPNIRTGATTPNIITGNFLGYSNTTGTTLTEDNTSVFNVKGNFTSFRGVRFLGLFGDSKKIADRTLFAAIASVDQPAVIPVLQLHVPNAIAADSDNIQQPDPSTTSALNGLPTSGTGQWTIRPTKTEVNVYFVAGNSPSRSDRTFRKSSSIFKQAADTSSTVTTTGETGGGLANFVRFLENWENVPIKISGGFIQNTRSRYATAPWTVAPAIAGVSDLTSIFLNPVLPRANVTTDTGRVLTGYNLQYMSATTNRIPYYTPPIRLWGYDVGLLKQQPDRFSERFASPIAGSNEFFREVSADDPWVEALLCALEPNDAVADRTGTIPSNYTNRALRGKDLRSACNSKINGKFKYGGSGDNPAISY